MTARKVWTFVRSGKIEMNDGYDPQYPPHQYPIVIKGFLDHDPEREIVMPISVPENEQIARQLLDLGGKWVKQKAAEDAEEEGWRDNVVHFRSASYDGGPQ